MESNPVHHIRMPSIFGGHFAFVAFETCASPACERNSRMGSVAKKLVK